jgi:hypothetical protein
MEPAWASARFAWRDRFILFSAGQRERLESWASRGGFFSALVDAGQKVEPLEEPRERHQRQGHPRQQQQRQRRRHEARESDPGQPPPLPRRRRERSMSPPTVPSRDSDPPPPFPSPPPPPPPLEVAPRPAVPLESILSNPWGASGAIVGAAEEGQRSALAPLSEQELRADVVSGVPLPDSLSDAVRDLLRCELSSSKVTTNTSRVPSPASMPALILVAY